MPPTIPPEVRQIEQLLQEKLIPWAQGGAPLVFLGTPPRSLTPLQIMGESKTPLPAVTARRAYPHVKVWPTEGLNSIDVPVLGCTFAGQANYQIRRPPDEEGMQWTVPLQAKTFFFIPPGIPFTRGPCHSDENYARGVLIHLRRDSVSCFTHTLDHGKVWQNPYVLLHEFDAQLLAWRLLEEWRKPALSIRIIYHYTSLILDLMLRALQEKRYTNLHGIASTPEQPQDFAAIDAGSEILIHHAKAYIGEHLEDPNLSCADIALHTGVSTRHLERLFKQKTGMTPFEFVGQQRLDKACVLLLGPGLSIRHVAYYCGFRQPSHFSKWFARQTNSSPREFRSKNKLDVLKR